MIAKDESWEDLTNLEVKSMLFIQHESVDQHKRYRRNVAMILSRNIYIYHAS